MNRQILSLAAVVMFVTGARAQDPPKQDQSSVRLLAMAFVAEAGWADPRHEKAKRDHTAIFHVLKRRWSRLRERYPTVYPRFDDMVRSYVAALDPRTEKGRRVRWLQSLSSPERANGEPPVAWPSNLSWPAHRVWWLQALERASNCLAGQRCRDPYRGRALHWGGGNGLDPPQGCMVELPNRGTYNTFYAVGVDCKKKRRRAAATARRRNTGSGDSNVEAKSRR